MPAPSWRSRLTTLLRRKSGTPGIDCSSESTLPLATSGTVITVKITTIPTDISFWAMKPRDLHG